MKNIVYAIALFFMMILVTGCVQTDIRKPNYAAGVQQWEKDPDNVDMSDMDQNLTETELLITENMSSDRMDRMQFPVEEYYRLSRTGNGTIKGKIYLRTAYNGSMVMGGGTRLYLNPKTSYSDEWYSQSYVGGKKMTKADSRLFNYLKFTAANSDGSFAFYGVPSGKYYLIGTVSCGSECGFSGTKNIRLATEVEVYGGQTKVQDLTRTVQ